jgi:endonuclease YncB( thermonuclease family)
MLGRLDTDDPAIGIKDVGVELVRAGLARVQPGFGGDLAKAENEARQAGRGLWAAAQPQ